MPTSLQPTHTKQTPIKQSKWEERNECVTETHKNNWPPEFGYENIRAESIRRRSPATEMEMEMKLSSVNVQTITDHVRSCVKIPTTFGMAFRTQNTYHINLNHRRTHMRRRKVEMGKFGDSERVVAKGRQNEIDAKQMLDLKEHKEFVVQTEAASGSQQQIFVFFSVFCVVLC